MGVSFKVSRTGSRYRPRLPVPDPSVSVERCADHEDGEQGLGLRRRDREGDMLELHDNSAACSVSSANYGRNSVGPDHEASFSLNLFPDGFSIGKPIEGMLLPLLEDVPKSLHPYDRASETLFSALEHGYLPGNILDDIPCKYNKGAIICEVWDYQTCLSKLGNTGTSGDEFPKVQKVCLQMGLENVVKDMPSISDDSWTYNDLLQAESRIIKALQPMLYLGPKPSLDRLYRKPVSKQLDLGKYQGRPKRKQHGIPEVNLKPTDLFDGWCISSNGFVGNLKSQTCFPIGDGADRGTQYDISRSMPHVQQNNTGKDVRRRSLQMAFHPNSNSAVSCSISVPKSVAVTSNLLSARDQNLRDSCISMNNSVSFLVGRSSRYESETAPTPLKMPKQEPPDSYPDQIVLSQRDTMIEQLQQKSSLFRKQLKDEKMLHFSYGDQNYPLLETNEPITERIPKLEAEIPSLLDRKGIQCSVKEEPHTETGIFSKPEVERNKKDNVMNFISEKSIQAFMRSLPPQMQWSNSSMDRYPKKENASRKRKLSQVPQVSDGGTARSVSKMGEIQRISSGTSSTFPTVAAVELHKEKSASVTAAVNSGSSNTLVCEDQISLNTKKKAKTRSKIPTLKKSGIGPPTVSVSNAPFSSNSSSVGTVSVQPPSGMTGDPSLLERFSRIEMVSQRHGLGYKRQKVDKYPTRKSLSHCTLPPARLLKPEKTEELMCLSKCPFTGSSNASKTRILTFVRLAFFYQGNGIDTMVESCNKLVLSKSENPDDSKVGAEVIYGDQGQRIPIALLSNDHDADLFAAQFTSLMKHDGYEFIGDRLHPTPLSNTGTSSSFSAHIGWPEVAQFPCTTLISGQSVETLIPINNSFSNLHPQRSPSQNILSPTRMPSSYISLTSPQQLDVDAHVSSMQQQFSQNQKYWQLVKDNLLADKSMQMGNQMLDSPTHLQFPRLQQFQHQQYQQQANLQMDLTSFGVTSNACKGCVSSINDVGQISSNLGQISGFNNSNQQSLNRGISQAQAALLTKTRVQSRGMGSMDSITGNRAVLDMSRSCMDQLQSIDKIPMDLPKIPSINLLTVNYDQQGKLQQQLSSPQQEQRGKLQQQLSSPQEEGPPLMTQIIQPTPMSQEQLCSVSLPQQVNAGIGNTGSPQLSSQTVGSGGSVTSTPMDLQGISKGGTDGNSGIMEV